MRNSYWYVQAMPQCTMHVEWSSHCDFHVDLNWLSPPFTQCFQLLIDVEVKYFPMSALFHDTVLVCTVFGVRISGCCYHPTNSQVKSMYFSLNSMHCRDNFAFCMLCPVTTRILNLWHKFEIHTDSQYLSIKVE